MLRTTLLIALALLVAAATAQAHDPTKLPIGDGKYSATSAAKGSIYTCRASYQGGGAFQKGPWFNSDGSTFDFTKKAIVDGSVSWPAARVSFSLQGSNLVLTGNGLPVGGTTGNFPIAAGDDAYNYDRNPNTVRENAVTLTLPANPVRNAAASCVSGTVGYALNGVAILDGLDAGGRDAVAWEVQDSCQGHPHQRAYHYHSVSTCQTSYKSGRSHSGLVGYALDGFGIYGPRGEDGDVLSNSSLDACHGHRHEVKFHGKTKDIYHYHATREYPYTVGCFRGSATRSP